MFLPLARDKQSHNETSGKVRAEHFSLNGDMTPFMAGENLPVDESEFRHENLTTKNTESTKKRKWSTGPLTQSLPLARCTKGDTSRKHPTLSSLCALCVLCG